MCTGSTFLYVVTFNYALGFVHKNHTWYYKLSIEYARPTNVSDVPRSLQSWVSTIQSVVLTADVFQFFIKFLPSSSNYSCTTVPTAQRFTAVGTRLYFFLCYYFHVVYPTLLLKLYYSVTRSVLLVTCRLQYCSSYSVLYGPFCKKDTVCAAGFNCSDFVTLLQRYVKQCLRIIMCCLHTVCCTVIFLYCSVDALLYTVFHV